MFAVIEAVLAGIGLAAVVISLAAIPYTMGLKDASKLSASVD